MAKEIVTGVALEGNGQELAQKMMKVLSKDFDFFADVNVKPFSKRVLADKEGIPESTKEQFESFDGKLLEWTNGNAANAYVENGLVFPEDVPAVQFDVPASKDVYLKDNKVTVQMQPQGKVPGVYYVQTSAMHEDGMDASMEYVVFLDGKKMGQAIGVATKEVERGELGDDGQFVLRESTQRPEAVVEREIAEPKKERKSVLEQNMEAGYPDRIKDMGTGFNRVYMKTYAGSFSKLKHADLFPRDKEAACPVLADARINLGDMTLIGVKIEGEGKRQKIDVSYSPAVLQLNLAHYENDYTAYGPALAKDAVAGRPNMGTIYYMDVTGMEEDAIRKMEDSITSKAKEAALQGKDVTDIVLRDIMEHGAKSPVLALGKEFDTVVREYEAKEIQRQQEEQDKAARKEMEIEARNAAIKEEVRYKRKTRQPIEPEKRDIIFVHKPVTVGVKEGKPKTICLLEPPDKEKGEDYYKLKFRVGYRDMEVRVPAASKELGIDGKPLTFVKGVKNEFSDLSHIIKVSHKLGKQFPVFCNGQEVNPVGYAELYSFMELKNQELRILEGKEADKRMYRDETRQKSYEDKNKDFLMREEERRSLRSRRSQYPKRGGGGRGDD